MVVQKRNPLASFSYNFKSCVPKQTCVLAKFVQNLLFAFVFRNVADEQADVGDGYVDSQFLAGLNVVAIQLSTWKTFSTIIIIVC